MPKQINLPTYAQGLVSRFALKGRFQPVLDETIVPVVIVSSFEGSGGSGVPIQAERRLASGYALMKCTWTGPDTDSRWYFALRNPAGSGVGLSITAASIGISWDFGRTYPSLQNRIDFYGYQITVDEIKAYTAAPGAFPNLTTEKGWRDDRLQQSPPPIAQVDGSLVNNGGLTDRVIGMETVPDLFEQAVELLKPNGDPLDPPEFESSGLQGVPVEQVNAVLIRPGNELTIRQLFSGTGTGHASKANVPCYCNFTWEEIPLTAGNPCHEAERASPRSAGCCRTGNPLRRKLRGPCDSHLRIPNVGGAGTAPATLGVWSIALPGKSTGGFCAQLGPCI